MDPIRFSVDRPVTVSVAVLLVVLFGLIAIGQIPIQLTPNIETTVISVSTRWEGATPEQVKNEIIIEQEDKLQNISGLTKMIATAGQGSASISLEFNRGVTKEEALREVSDKLREVPSYPENVDEPVVEATNPADRDFIAWVVFSTTDPDYDIRELQDYLYDRVKPELERVRGISEVNVLGGWEPEVQVKVDPQRLAAYGLGPSAVTDALRAQNQDASGGRLAEGKRDIRVRAVGRFSRLHEIENTLLSAPGEPPVLVKDVATVASGFKEVDRIVRNKGRTVVALNAQREVGSNVIEVMAGFQDRLRHVQAVMLPAEARRLGIDGDFNLEQVYDQTLYIHQAVDLVTQNLWVGGVLAVVVLLLFLRNVRTTAIIALAIPTSVIGTFLVMVVTGRSLNVISLAGLAFAVGMVVDNAIVVLENIDRHIQLGEKPMTAAYRGAKEVWGAILASTLTTLAVFVPILTIQEEAGQLFRDIAIAICAAVALSLIVSISVIPSAGSRWLRDRSRRRSGALSAVGDLLAGPGRAVTMGLRNTLAFLQRTWALRLGIIALLTTASLVGAYFLMPPTGYLPPGNRNLVFAMMSTPPGTNLEKRTEMGLAVEDNVRPFWEARDDPARAADLPEVTAFDISTMSMKTVQPPAVRNFFFVVTPDRMFMGAISDDNAQVSPHAALLNSTISQLPDTRGFAIQMPLFRTASQGTGDALELEIRGSDLSEVNSVASLLLGRYAARFGRISPTPSNFDKLGEEVRAERSPVKDVNANRVGLGQREINTAMQVFGDGLIVGDYLMGNDTVDLKVMSATNNGGDATYMRHLPLATPSGQIVTLDHVREIRRTLAAETIIRIEAQDSVTLSINLGKEYPLEQAMTDIESDIVELRDAGQIPASVATTLQGSAAKLKQVKEAMLGEWSGANSESIYSLIQSRMFLALLVVFLLMAALFESWLYPLVIMISVPLATVGGFAGLATVHAFFPEQQLDMLTMLGFVILMGIVVNNAILIVHQSLNLMRGVAEVQVEGEIVEKLPPAEAIAEAVRTRVRPIFMTMCTSVGGMLPLVLFPGSGSELYRGLGSVVVGGLIVSTLFTLVLVPLLLSVVFDLRRLVVGGLQGASDDRSESEPVPAEAPVGK